MLRQASPPPTSTATKVAVGTGLAAIFGGLLVSLAKKPSPSPAPKLGRPCGHCGR